MVNFSKNEGITWAFQKVDIFDKVVGKISEVLAMLPPETERNEKNDKIYAGLERRVWSLLEGTG